MSESSNPGKMDTPEPLAAALTEHVRHEIDQWVAKFPPDRKRSAVIAALRAVQHDAGYLTRDTMDAVAHYLGLPPVQVYEVATFYSMFETKPVGRHSISVCTGLQTSSRQVVSECVADSSNEMESSGELRGDETESVRSVNS